MFYEVFSIGRITVHGYGLMIAIGILCAILLASYRAKRKGLDEELVFNLLIVAIVFGFLGAKLMYVLQNFRGFLSSPLDYLGGTGFIVYGGIILGVIATIVYCRIKNMDFLRYFDLFMPSVSVAQGFGRIGCLAAGCCYGQRTNSIFGIVFQHSPFAPAGVKLIPTQIMSSAGNFAIAAILLIYARKDRRKGKVGLLYLALYGVGRFIVEFFRYDYEHTIWFMTISQFISIIVFIIATVFFILYRKKDREEAQDKSDTKDIDKADKDKTEDKKASETDDKSEEKAKDDDEIKKEKSDKEK